MRVGLGGRKRLNGEANGIRHRSGPAREYLDMPAPGASTVPWAEAVIDLSASASVGFHQLVRRIQSMLHQRSTHGVVGEHDQGSSFAGGHVDSRR
jgi:hypothetical protein